MIDSCKDPWPVESSAEENPMGRDEDISISRSGSDLAPVDARVIQPHEYDELSEITDDLPARAGEQRWATEIAESGKADVLEAARGCHQPAAGDGPGVADEDGSAADERSEVKSKGLPGLGCFVQVGARRR